MLTSICIQLRTTIVSAKVIAIDFRKGAVVSELVGRAHKRAMDQLETMLRLCTTCYFLSGEWVKMVHLFCFLRQGCFTPRKHRRGGEKAVHMGSIQFMVTLCTHKLNLQVWKSYRY